MEGPANAKLEQQRNWNGVAEGWGRWLAWTERNFGPVADWLREAARSRSGGRILDVACGAGFPALEIARSVGPARIVACDLSPRMLAIARGCARARRVSPRIGARRDRRDRRLGSTVE
jgi:enediyne biosynthesis protein CalE5